MKDVIKNIRHLSVFICVVTAGCLALSAPKPPSVSYVVHCDSNDGAVKPGVLGVNGPDKYTDWAGNAEVTRRLREGGFKVVRMGLVQDGLYQKRDIYPKPGQWRFKEMDTMLKSIFDAGAEPLLGVIGFPAGVEHRLDSENKIAQADWAEYARFAAGAVKHYNVDHALGPDRKIRYWELWNEPNDEPEGKFQSRAQYAEFVRTVAAAMKKVDPTVKLIGPVHSWSDLGPDGWVAFGAKELGQYLDILCWHDYGGGPDQSDADRMAWPRQHYGTNVSGVLSGGSERQFVGPSGKKFGAAITEYNMAWQDGPPEYKAKFHSAYNATYIGTALVRAMRSNLDLFCFYVFTQAGRNQLGLVDNVTYKPYKPFYVFPLFSSHMGTWKLKTEGEYPGLELIATGKKDGAITIFVVNSTASAQTATVTLAGAKQANGKARVWTVDDQHNGQEGPSLTYTNKKLSFAAPPFSVSAIEIR